MPVLLTMGPMAKMGAAAKIGRAAGWAALAGATVVVAFTALLLVDQRSNAYGATSPEAAVATVGTAFALLAAAVVATLYSRRRSVGLLLACLAVCWISPVWAGWHDGSGLVRSVGSVAASLLMPLLVHLTLVESRGGRQLSARRRAVDVCYSIFGFLVIAIALVRDPFLDLDCWNNCTDNAFLLVRLPELAQALEAVLLGCSVLAGVLVIAWIARTLALASPVGRAEGAVRLIPIALAVVAESGYALSLLAEPGEDPRMQPFLGLFYARSFTLVCVAIGVGWFILRGEHRRVAVGRLADDLGTVPRLGSFRSALAITLGDPELEVLYWLPDTARFVDSTGREREPTSTSSRAVTTIRRNGELVAMVMHRLGDDDRFVDQIGAAARLVIDNERLQAGVLAQLTALRASRLRVVEASDTVRRKIERNLHDGAQQSLVALLYALSLARAQASAMGDRHSELEFAAIGDAAADAAQRLRTIAHGVFPAILEDAGLGAAIQSIAEDAPVTVEVINTISGRFPRSVEHVAYRAVSAAVEASTASRQLVVRVSVAEVNGQLVVTADGVPRGDFSALSDRIGALGGTVESAEGQLRVVIPCV
jgi:signal transduction histidine kinase